MPQTALMHRCLSECYFAVKGAAVVLSHSSSVILPRGGLRSAGPSTSAAVGDAASSSQGEIQVHLTAMLQLLRPHDTLKMAVRLESAVGGTERTRYMAIVSTNGVQDKVESAILGIDYSGGRATLGLVLPVYCNTQLGLDGEGSIRVSVCEPPKPVVVHVFKPVSVQAMWSAFQSLWKEKTTAVSENYFDGGLTHTWLGNYKARVDSPKSFIAEWHFFLPIEDHETLLQAHSLARFKEKAPEVAAVHADILAALRDIMQSVDLDEVNTRDIRLRLEARLGHELGEHRSYFDATMMTILGQMERPSRIFSFLYLGTEWNASNWDELIANRVTSILNVTKEVDNFFQGQFDYMKITVSDEASSELLSYWDQCYRFIKNACTNQGAVLVHCKKGISRSSSTVIAFAMKEYGWDLETALDYVKVKRQCITPNKGFMQQLKTYQGILDASRNRNSVLWNSPAALDTSAASTASGADMADGVPTLEELAGLAGVGSSPSSVIYSEKANHAAQAVPTLVAMSSGNILKPGRQSLPSSSDPMLFDESDEEDTREVLNISVDDELPPALRWSQPQHDSEAQTYYRGIRPVVKKHYLEKLSRTESELGAVPLKRVQDMIVAAPHNLSSSSGCSSDSASTGSLSDDADVLPTPQRRNSKSSADSAVYEPAKPGLLRSLKNRLRLDTPKNPPQSLAKEESPPDEGTRGPKSKWLRNLHQKKAAIPGSVSSSPSLGNVAKSGKVQATRRKLEDSGKGEFFRDPGSQRHLRLSWSPADPNFRRGLLSRPVEETPTSTLGGRDKNGVRSLVQRFDATRVVDAIPGAEDAEDVDDLGRFHRSGSLSTQLPAALATPIISRAMSLTFHHSPALRDS